MFVYYCTSPLDLFISYAPYETVQYEMNSVGCSDSVWLIPNTLEWEIDA